MFLAAAAADVLSLHVRIFQNPSNDTLKSAAFGKKKKQHSMKSVSQVKICRIKGLWVW